MNVYFRTDVEVSSNYVFCGCNWMYGVSVD